LLKSLLRIGKISNLKKSSFGLQLWTNHLLPVLKYVCLDEIWNIDIQPKNKLIMAIKINHKEGIIKVSGELSSEKAMMLKQHFESFQNELDEIILSLDDVTYIEPAGAFTMEQLYLEFIKSNRIIQIIGRDNKCIAETMKNTKTSYILSNDRV